MLWLRCIQCICALDAFSVDSTMAVRVREFSHKGDSQMQVVVAAACPEFAVRLNMNQFLNGGVRREGSESNSTDLDEADDAPPYCSVQQAAANSNGAPDRFRCTHASMITAIGEGPRRRMVKDTENQRWAAGTSGEGAAGASRLLMSQGSMHAA